MADYAGAKKFVELIQITMGEDWSFDVRIGKWFWIIPIIVIASSLAIRWCRTGSVLGRSYEIDSAEFGVGNSKLTFKPNINDKSVAYKIWVELSTRKIGLPIDFDDDVIFEIYESWYSFFAVTRELIKDIPVQKVRNNSTKQIILLSINVLNIGLRPHLTKWQARFKRWYEHKLSTDQDAKLHPQDIQKEFPSYDELVSDMKDVNERLIRYRDRMNDLVHS